MKAEKIKHLEFIQSVINRMANNSFMVKGWSITLISGLFALSFSVDGPLMVFLPLIPALSFWLLDAYYLRQEKLFRQLYDQSRRAYIEKSVSFELLNMNVETYDKKVKNYFQLAFSRTLIWFHGINFLLVISGIAFFFIKIKIQD